MRLLSIIACVLVFGCAPTDSTAPMALLQQVAPASVTPPRDLCQSTVEDYSYCEFERCPQPWPSGCPSEMENDCDGILDKGPNRDNCAYFCNPGQENADGDELGDVCDDCPLDGANDMDNDGLCANVDNCPHIFNLGQENTDGDALGDACDELPNTPSPEQSIADLDARLDVLEAALLMGQE